MSICSDDGLIIQTAVIHFVRRSVCPYQLQFIKFSLHPLLVRRKASHLLTCRVAAATGEKELVTFSKWAVNRSAVTHNRNRFNSFNNPSRPTHHPGICTLRHSPPATSVALLVDKGRCALQFNDIFSFVYQVYYLPHLPNPPTPTPNPAPLLLNLN